MCATTIRRATRDDAHAIALIHVRSWQHAYRGLVPDALLDGLSVEQRRTIWRQLLDNNGAMFTLVAERATEPVGFCSMTTPSRDDDDAAETTCEVAAIYVAPQAWRTGVGYALLATALHDVRQDSWHEVTLWVFSANAGAVAFYNGFGFVPDGAETHHEPSGQLQIRLRALL
jgi:GNAT superfamily N-acetyltransferase